MAVNEADIVQHEAALIMHDDAGWKHALDVSIVISLHQIDPGVLVQQPVEEAGDLDVLLLG